MTLSKTTRKKIATAARQLALECLAGKAPKFSPFNYDSCALGVIAQRVGVRPGPGPMDEPGAQVEDITITVDDAGYDPFHEGWIVSEALVQSSNKSHADRQAALVFPLLAFADAVAATTVVRK